MDGICDFCKEKAYLFGKSEQLCKEHYEEREKVKLQRAFDNGRDVEKRIGEYRELDY